MSKTFHVYIDIAFHEDNFPFHSLFDNNNNHDDPFHNIALPNFICDFTPHDHDEYTPNHVDAQHDNPNSAELIILEIPNASND